jgi:small subunit ribosomal protein S19e
MTSSARQGGPPATVRRTTDRRREVGATCRFEAVRRCQGPGVPPWRPLSEGGSSLMLNTSAGWPRRPMTHPNDVPASALLPKLAAELRSRSAVAPPPWADFVKTGVHKERAPQLPDWWYLRSASVLRKIYLKGSVGVTRLAAEYGGKRDRGSAPYHARSGSRSVAREIVQQLEKSGLVQRYKTQGRRVSPEGQRLLDTVSRDILKSLAEERPALAKYL